MAEQFTQRLPVSLLLFKCANHFFHYSTKGENERDGKTEGAWGREKLTKAEMKLIIEKDRVHVQIMYSPMVHLWRRYTVIWT